METSFSENLLNLRKEKGISQKKAASDLGISQALLSHYEKGIRECGLNFVLKVSRYYDVSCDFILGADKNNNTKKTPTYKYPEEKILSQSINILFSCLKKIGSKALLKECTNYLCTAVYTVIRHVCSDKSMYSLDKELYSAISSSNMTMSKAKIKKIIMNENIAENMPKITLKPESDKSESFSALVKIAEQE